MLHVGLAYTGRSFMFLIYRKSRIVSNGCSGSPILRVVINQASATLVGQSGSGSYLPAVASGSRGFKAFFEGFAVAPPAFDPPSLPVICALRAASAGPTLFGMAFA